ncbi:MAG: hypothetical protein PW845_17530 [Pseudomonas sp.]|nr:hypothetical protein [Pseudomonas sp.]
MYTTDPNPRVGCVLVKNGAVIGEGFTQPAGQDHAEIRALKDARSRGHDSARRHRLRDAGAMQPLRPHAAVRQRAFIEAEVALVVAAMEIPIRSYPDAVSPYCATPAPKCAAACSPPKRTNSISASSRA